MHVPREQQQEAMMKNYVKHIYINIFNELFVVKDVDKGGVWGFKPYLLRTKFA